MGVVAFVDRQGLSGYDLGTDHPLAPVNRELAIDLIRAYGMLDRPDVTVLQPAPGDEDLIGRVHTAAYMAAVRRYSATPQLAAAFAQRFHHPTLVVFLDIHDQLLVGFLANTLVFPEYDLRA